MQQCSTAIFLPYIVGTFLLGVVVGIAAFIWLLTIVEKHALKTDEAVAREAGGPANKPANNAS